MSGLYLIDAVALAAALFALLALWQGRGRIFGRDAWWLLLWLLALIIFHHLSNVLEWSGVTDVLDSFEDYFEILLPAVWFFFIFAVGRERFTEALRESRERFRSLVETTSDWIWEVGADNRYTYSSPKVEEVLGYKPDEILGKTPFDLMSTDEAKRVKAIFDTVKAEHRAFNAIENINLHKDGRLVVLETSGSPIISKDGVFMGYHGIDRDITERKKAEEQIRTLSQAIEQSPVTVMITDPDGNITYVNSTFERLTGYSVAEVIGRNPRILKSGKTPPARYEELWQAISNGKSWQGEFQNCRKNGELFWERAHIAPVLDDNGKIRHYLAVKEDVTRHKLQEERILHQAHFDSLTNIPNRFLALDRLTQLIKEAHRTGHRVAVLFLDLDDFKKINDSLGHEAGDRLLVQAAERLGDVLRDSDTIGRLGGDEFIVLLGGLEDAADARPVAESLLDRFRDAFRLDERELVLTASLGIAIYPEDGDSPTELLRNADTAMYHSKEQGRNTYSYFTEAMNIGVSRRLALEEQLHGALGRGEFRLCYQPVVDIKKRCLIGVEALLRWNNPALGDVSPEEFIPIAEQTGLIVPIGQYVLTEALGRLDNWQKGRQQGLKMAVNLSPSQFRDPNLLPFIEEALQRAGVSGEFLQLEITEGVLMSGYGHIVAALADLNKLGVGIAMDDFGTGYSSLSYLRNYPFDILKIDRSFVVDITVDEADRELVNAAIAMGHGLGLKVVAEGVETEEQLTHLMEHGCDFAQGYLFSKPVSPEEITKMLEGQLD